MKSLNKSSELTFNKLIKMIPKESGYLKLEKSNGVFMPVVVEKYSTNCSGDIYFLAHTFEQNGDLMSDPAMTFLKSNIDEKFYPLDIRQDPVGVYRNAVWFDERGQIEKVAPNLQFELTQFGNMWLKNIKEQQKL